MTTPIYQLPYPSLSTIADGPDAVQDLALRVERQMTLLQSVTNYNREVDTNLSWGTGVPVHSMTTPLSVIGWVEVEVEILIGGLNEAQTLFAGNVWLDCNSTRLRTIRYHNKGLSRAVEKTFTGVMPISAAVTSLNTVVSVQSDPNSPGHIYHMSNVSVRQYGAPATG